MTAAATTPSLAALHERALDAVWWCSWTFPTKHCTSKKIAAAFPAGLEGWISGYTIAGDLAVDLQIWCGRIEAPTRDAAIALVSSMYGSLAKHVRWRFGPDEKPPGWRPGDRFPRQRSE